MQKEELRSANNDHNVRAKLRQLPNLMLCAEDRLNEYQKGTLKEGLKLSTSLEVVYRFRLRLQEIYEQRGLNRESLLFLLQLVLQLTLTYIILNT